MEIKSELKEFQKETVKRMEKMEKRNDGGMILSHAGTGKSICILDEYIRRPVRTLIVCPAGIINNWENEIKKHTRNVEYTKYHGNKRNEGKRKNLVITTYTIISEEYKNNTGFTKERFGRIILDEGHYIRNIRSNITKGIMQLGESNVNAKKWIVTATPIFNKKDDMFASFRFLGICESKGEWNKEINNTINGLKVLNEWVRGNSIKYRKDEVLKELNKKEEIIVKLRFTETEREFYDSLRTYSQERITRLVKTISILKRDASFNNIKLLLRSHVLTLILRLKQACNSPMLVMSKMKRISRAKTMNEAMKILIMNKVEDDCPICYDEKANYMADPCGHCCCKGCWEKLFKAGVMTCPTCRGYVEDIEEIRKKKKRSEENSERSEDEGILMSTKMLKMFKIIKEKIRTGEKVVVVSQWVKMLDIIRELIDKRYPKLRYTSLQGNLTMEKRTKNINEFENDPNIRICFVSLLSSAEGINLVSANNMILLDAWWNNAKMSQVMDRIHRIGQEKDVKIYKFEIEDTIEERIRELVNRKSKIADIIVENLKIDESYDDKWIKSMVRLL
jgi:SNF2 family DNA or RNA helicase